MDMIDFVMTHQCWFGV